MVNIIMAIFLFTNLFPVAPIPGECRIGMKRDSGGGEKTKTNKKTTLPSFGPFFEPEQKWHC